MAAEINWHRYGTKLRHCHPVYITIQDVNSIVAVRGKLLLCSTACHTAVSPSCAYTAALTRTYIRLYSTFRQKKTCMQTSNNKNRKETREKNLFNN